MEEEKVRNSKIRNKREELYQEREVHRVRASRKSKQDGGGHAPEARSRHVVGGAAEAAAVRPERPPS